MRMCSNEIRRNGFITRLMRITIVLMAMLCLPAYADDPMGKSVQFDIPAQSLSSALINFSTQSGMQVATADIDISKLQSHAVSGNHSIREAMGILLGGTGLDFAQVGTSTITVKSKSPSAAIHPPDSSKRTVAKSDKEKTQEFEKITVAGSRIPLAAQEQAQPVLVFTAEDLDRSGQTTVTDFLNNLPQMSIASSPGPIQTWASQRGVQLHGLPIGTTLVLIDGLRPQISYYGSLDLSMIPASAIERIEVVPVGSSAIYGSDAIAGVINLVLKKHFDGIETSAKYGAANDTEDFTASAAFGKDWGRGSFSLIVSGQKQTDLSMAERERTAMGTAGLRTDACSPGTVYALNGGTLPGLGTSSAAIPTGLSGKPAISDFASTAGKVNECNLYSKASLIPASEQQSAVFNGHFEITPSLDLFGTVLYSHFTTAPNSSEAFHLYGGSYGGSILPASNAYNPFGVNVGISWADAYATSTENRVETMVRPVIGLRGDLVGDWHWEATAMYSHDDFTVVDSYKNYPAIYAALASSDPTSALNVFTTGAPGTPDLLSTLVFNQRDRYEQSLASAQLVLRGPLFDLPAGPVQSAFGANYDRMKIWNQFVNSITGNTLEDPSNRSRTSYAIFTEERVPIIAGDRGSDGGEVLALSLAARYDHSNDFGGKPTYQAGLEWRPVESVLFRADYGTAYRAPELSQLYGVFSQFTSTVTDPKRGGTSYSIDQWLDGPNPNLKPETGNSKSVGVVYSSKLLDGFESSLTWWSVDYANYIGYPSYLDVINFPNDFPAGLVVRAAPTADDLAKGWLGQITEVRNVPVNYGSIRVAGVDLNAKYRIVTSMGTWTPSVAFTETYRYAVALRPGQPEQNNVSQASSSPGYAPRWKGNVALNWQMNAWTASVTGRYIGPYKDYAGWGAPVGYEIGNTWEFDTSVRYRLGDLWPGTASLKDSYISVGGVNIFNRQPPVSYYFWGYDYQQTNLRGRFLYVQAGTKF